ncbi:hypothetical protein CALVIDRAFT_393638 [Calocera viscosa TUFC12733]|uniref:BRCT domain-containing protein n=1 Tax=Calocera viscosa (strain TUFC12733) TaxID=1330018 RepID=A0A167GD82_CALVF|nr:hypothetical protein CALVIDRAFT_393638 [Calocera viscosa TUFC12733]
MQDSVGRPKDLFVDKKGLPLAFYLPPQCIDETDALQDDLATHGGSLCRSMQDAHIILVDPTRLAALNDVQSHQVVLNKTWLKLCLVANSILDADTNWANQVLTKHMDNSQFQKTGRPPLKITTSMDKLTLPSIRDLGLLKGNPLTHPSPIRRPGTLCNQIPAVSRSSRYSTPDDPSDRPATRDVYSDHSPRYTSSRLYDPPSGHAQDNRVRSTGKHEESRRQNWGYPSSPLYRRPYRYAAPDRPPQGHRGYADTDYERDGSIGFEYSSARREYDRAPEDPRRIAPPRYPSRYPDPIREDKYFGGVFERPSEELYYPPQSRDDRFSPPNKHSPRSYAYTMSEDYTRASPGPPSYSSSSPEDRGYPATPEKRSDLRVVQYDPNRFDPFERPAQRVYRGG